MSNNMRYGHLFDNTSTEVELDFDKLIVEVTEENKHILIPILIRIGQAEEHKSKLREVCEQMSFDITCLEHGVSPDAQGRG